MPVNSDSELRQIFEVNVITVVGCSSTPGKAAHEIPRYLQTHGYTIIPVNPNAEVVLGTSAYDSISDIEEHVSVLNVFRPSSEVAEIIDQTLQRDDVEVIWLQLGIHDDEAVARAEESGCRVVQDRCMKPEYQRLVLRE